MALDEIIVRYGADISDLKKELDDLKKQTVGFEKQTEDSSKKVEQSLNSVGTNVSGKLTSAFKVLGSTIAAAFTINAIGNFISSSIELATRTQEIKAEFDKLNNPALLANLKKSTEGTLSDLKLMEVALRADKLGVPLDKLGKIMEFAKLRADALGKSTEELTDTLVQGIGIKGTRALAQVGISQEQFSEEIKKTGDYFTALDNIMTKTLDEAGTSIDSVADKQDRLNASIANSKAAIGNAFLPVIDNILSGITKVITGWQMLADGTTFAEKQAYDVTVDYLTKKTTSWIEYQQLLLKTQKDIFNAEKAISEGSEKDRQAAKESLPIYQMRLKALQEYNMEYFKTKGVVKETTAAVVENTEVTDKQVKTFGDLDEQTETLLKTTGAVNETYVDLTLLMSQAQEQMAAGDEAAYNATLSKMADIMIAIGTEDLPTIKAALTDFNAVVVTGNDVAKDWYENWEDYGHKLVELFDSLSYFFKVQEDYKLQVLQERLEEGTISEGQYDRDVKEIQIAQAKRAKLLSIFDVLSKTPPAIMQGFAQLGPIGAILAAALGVTQLATALATPIPAFKTGVVDFKGVGTGTSDENLVRISNRESIITAKGTAKHKGVLEAINKDKFDEYISNIYLKNILKEKSGVDDSSYREYLELKRLGYINQTGFKQLVDAINNQKPHRF